MLHNQGIRTKLLGVLALPILALTMITAVVSLQSFERARKASQIEQLATGSGALGALVSTLQAERSVSVAFVNKAPVGAELKKARAATDAALLTSNTEFASVDLASLTPHALEVAGQAQAGHATLKALRATVSGGRAQRSRVVDAYSTIIAADILVPRQIGDGLTDRAFGSKATAFSSAQQLVELATQERDLGLAMISAGAADPVSAGAMARLAALQTEAGNVFRHAAPAEGVKALTAALSQPVALRAAYRDLQRSLLAAGGTGQLRLDGSDWRNATNSRITALSTLAAPIGMAGAKDAADATSAARTRAYGVLAGGVLTVVALLLIFAVLSRAMIRPLLQLTDVAMQVRELLPEMVERMATPGDGPGVTMPEIPDSGDDEVGQLARVLRDVNSVTLQVAEEQAALRASIAEMFVNVARRNHVLLSRQLSFIDQLERSEEDPVTLDNLFRLDHLATRMRRNAESLIVLAGVDSGRRLRRPMPLSDVIRTAVSEIERYDRVDLALQVDPPMVGHVALNASHLLAELLENATQFSNPDTRVIVSTASTTNGVRVTVTDLGLGMTWDEISDANRRIANPPMSDVVGSQRLGFFVVGRLARRLGATVEFSPGQTQGAIVTIDLPPALFMPGTVIEGLGVDDEPLEISPPTGADAPVETPLPSPSRAALPNPALVSERRGMHSVDAAAVDAATAVLAGVPLLSASSIDPFGPDSVQPAAADAVAPGPLLPRREARQSPAQDKPGRRGTLKPAAVPSPQSAAAPRTGIFSGFRARRHITASAGEAKAPAVSAPQVDNAPSTFTPAVLSAASHHLPTRIDPTVASPVRVTQEPAASVFAVLEPPYEPTVPEAVPAQQAQAKPDDDALRLSVPVVTQAHAGPAAAAPDTAAPDAAAPDTAGWGAHHALADLVDDKPIVVATAPQPAAFNVPPPARPPFAAVAAMDILPARGGGRGLRSRRHAKATPRPWSPVQSSFLEPPSTAPQLVTTPEAGTVSELAGTVAPNLFGNVFDSVPPGATSVEPLQGSSSEAAAAGEQAVPGRAAARALRERSAMASQALSELSALSTYRPDAVPTAPAAGLVRRTPQATSAGQLPSAVKEPTGTPRPERNAAEVRSMLSGFRAGVERGRTSPGAANHEDGESE